MFILMLGDENQFQSFYDPICYSISIPWNSKQQFSIKEAKIGNVQVIIL